jgi:xanthine dehydrogenase YagR molybdenum-binding subunit
MTLRPLTPEPMQDKLGLLFGTPTSRIDGVAKVTGFARFASDEPVANPAFAYLVTSAIARGRIAGFSLDQCQGGAGVLDILTFQNVGDQVKPAPGPDGKPSTTSLESDRIWHDGQIIAIVVADTYEAAREAANKVKVNYAPESPSATFDSPGIETEPHLPEKGPIPSRAMRRRRSPVPRCRSKAAIRRRRNTTMPIELFTTTCAWDGPKLTIYEPSQFMWGTKASAARDSISIPPMCGRSRATSAAHSVPRDPIRAPPGSPLPQSASVVR